MSSSVSDSGISISGESTTELSTSGLSLKTDRSKSPHLYFKDERISTSSVSDSGISISGESTTELSTSGLSLKTDRSKSPHLYFKDERISTSSVSDSGISISGESTTELSTSGLSLKTDRSKSPHLYFKDERISTRELVSAWLDQVEIRSSELLDPEKEPLEQVSNSEEEMKRLCRLLHEIGDSLERDDLFQEAIKRLDAKSNRQRLVQTMLLLGGAGLIAIMSLLKL